MLARGFLCRSFLQTFDDDDSGATGYQNNSSISVCVRKLILHVCMHVYGIYICMICVCMRDVLAWVSCYLYRIVLASLCT